MFGDDESSKRSRSIPFFERKSSTTHDVAEFLKHASHKLNFAFPVVGDVIDVLPCVVTALRFAVFDDVAILIGQLIAEDFLTRFNELLVEER